MEGSTGSISPAERASLRRRTALWLLIALLLLAAGVVLYSPGGRASARAHAVPLRGITVTAVEVGPPMLLWGVPGGAQKAAARPFAESVVLTDVREALRGDLLRGLRRDGVPLADPDARRTEGSDTNAAGESRLILLLDTRKHGKVLYYHLSLVLEQTVVASLYRFPVPA